MARQVTVQHAWRARLALLCQPQVLRRAGRAAVMVGTLLVGINQGDVILSGQLTRWVVVKCLCTPLLPFCVTLLGAFLNSSVTSPAADLRPGWAAIRRSMIIAVLVGSTLIVLNQGDIILAGAVTPLILLKILITPCVPFCVSLYGAYVTYYSALARQHGGRHAARHT